MPIKLSLHFITTVRSEAEKERGPIVVDFFRENSVKIQKHISYITFTTRMIIMNTLIGSKTNPVIDRKKKHTIYNISVKDKKLKSSQ